VPGSSGAWCALLDVCATRAVRFHDARRYVVLQALRARDGHYPPTWQRRVPTFHWIGFVETLVSVPWFITSVAAVAYEAVADRLRGKTQPLRTQRGYRNVPFDEDAQILRFADKKEE